MQRAEHRELLRSLKEQAELDGIPKEQFEQVLDRRVGLLGQLISRSAAVLSSQVPDVTAFVLAQERSDGELTATSFELVEAATDNTRSLPTFLTVPAVNGFALIESGRWPSTAPAAVSWSRSYASLALFKPLLRFAISSYQEEWTERLSKANDLYRAVTRLDPQLKHSMTAPLASTDTLLNAVIQSGSIDGLAEAIHNGREATFDQSPPERWRVFKELVDSRVTRKMSVGDDPIVAKGRDGSTRRYRVTDALFLRPDPLPFRERLRDLSRWAGPPSVSRNVRPLLVVAVDEGNRTVNQMFDLHVFYDRSTTDSTDRETLEKHGLEPESHGRRPRVISSPDAWHLLAEDIDQVLSALELRETGRGEIELSGPS